MDMDMNKNDREQITHDRNDIDKEGRSVDVIRKSLFQPESKSLSGVPAVHIGGAHQAAQEMTMMRARSVARLAIITTNRRISRCKVVIFPEAVVVSLAMRPLLGKAQTL
jgi:hypothetical protein